MARTKLTSGGSVNDAPAYATETASAGSNSLVLLFVTSGKSDLFTPTPGVPTVTFGDAAMAQVNTVAIGDRRLTCFQFTTAQAKSGTFAITFANGQDYCAWSAFAYSGVNTAAPVRQSKVVSAANVGTLALTLPRSARNACAGAVIVNAVVSVAPGPGLSEIDEIPQSQSFFERSATLETLDAQPLVENVTWSWPGAANAAALVVEVDIAEAAGGTGGAATPHPLEALIRRFEPVMFLHPDEKFVPSNAKRFVESATLWTTDSPADDRATWGAPPAAGGDFPRQPVATNLAAVQGEAGTFLGSLPAGNGLSETSFLELGGWNDAALSHESAVTATSSNVYADRDAIDVLYDSTLQDSRYWYHAEVFSPGRLEFVANSSSPDLRPIVALVPNATLLCYYLFFPAHQQSVECTGTKGVELASHAGDWQCLAILLQGDGSSDADRYQPRYVGFTGSRPAAGPDGFDAHQFDDDELTVMKVAPWRAGGPGESAMPTTTAAGRRLHPHVYVSNGSHSLYPDAGDHAVDPYPATAMPHDCGDSDSVRVFPPAPHGKNAGTSDLERQAEFWGIFLLKAIGGLVSGTVLGGPIGATSGGTAGFVTGIIEGFSATHVTFGAEQSTNADTPKADRGPESSAAAAIIKPADVVVSSGGATVIDWQVGQGVKIGGRTYDYVVDRDTQAWWPRFDGEGGYKGRWGQRVTDDTLPRRSGPTFPNYARMFLLALADLKGR